MAGKKRNYINKKLTRNYTGILNKEDGVIERPDVEDGDKTFIDMFEEFENGEMVSITLEKEDEEKEV